MQPPRNDLNAVFASEPKIRGRASTTNAMVHVRNCQLDCSAAFGIILYAYSGRPCPGRRNRRNKRDDDDDMPVGFGDDIPAFMMISSKIG